LNALETLRASGREDSELSFAKTVSGGGVKALLRRSEFPRESENAQEGIELPEGLILLLAETDRKLDQYPEVERSVAETQSLL
jgi:hypothetical protein